MNKELKSMDSSDADETPKCLTPEEIEGRRREELADLDLRIGALKEERDAMKKEREENAEALREAKHARVLTCRALGISSKTMTSATEPAAPGNEAAEGEE